MDAFDGDRDPPGAFAIDTEQARGRKDEQWPQPLAAADRSMAHGAVQVATRIVGDREQCIETPIDLRRHFAQCRLER